MKQILTMALGLLMAVTMQAQTYWNGTSDKTFSGSGTQTDPYLIGTPEQLAGLAERTNVDKEDFAGKYIKLTADIYLTNFNDTDTANWKEWHPIAHEWWNEGGNGIDTANFRGHFDGDGHTIYNLYYNGGAGWSDEWDPTDPFFDISGFLGTLDYTAFNRGLFARLDGGTIENLHLQNAHMCGINSTAFLVVKAIGNSVIRNCHVQGEFRGMEASVGAIASENEGLIEDCSANVNISPGGGGVIVHTNKESGVIRNCTASGQIYCTAMHTGAFAETNEGLIEKSTSSVAVTCMEGRQANNNIVGHNCGGFLLNNYGTVRECAATGDVTVDSKVSDIGGSAGFCQRNLGLIESCYSTGTITSLGSRETGVAQFAVNNGDWTSIREGFPVIRNCFSTSHIIYTEDSNNRRATGAFVYNYNGRKDHDYAAFPFCWFNANGVPDPTDGWQFNAGFACWEKSEAAIKSQSFVDTLNLCAAFLGTSQWELRNGIPHPTGVYIKNTSALLAGGEGTKESPYLILNKTQLKNFRWLVQHGYDFMNEYVQQTADIALNAPEEEWEYVEPEEWDPIGTPHTFPGFANAAYEVFMGNYDGGFHEIQNLYIENYKENQGLFGEIGSTQFDGQKQVVIQNLGVTDAFMVVKGTSGILASRVGSNAVLKQCWTSGWLETPNDEGSFGALVGYSGSNGYVLNCSSSARLIGYSHYSIGEKGSMDGDSYSGWLKGDTLVNYLFTGNINNGESGKYSSGYYNENVYEDGEVANITHDGRDPNGVRSTEWLQSKEYVNQLNATVARWNETFAEDEAKQLHYWQWNENAYPTVSPNAYDPGYAVSFNSNGGSEVVTVKVVPGSTILPPMRPKKDNYLFAGWYTDEALTQLFHFGEDVIEQNMTLYARWLEDVRFEVDVTPFSNKRAKTYHIQTAAQLRGFAYLQNGVYQDAEVIETPRDFTGKTIVLDNDIFLNDTAGWQQWGKGAYAIPWRPIGTATNTYQSRSEIPFKGTFDGQGHVIYGLYTERGGLPSMEMGGLFHLLGESAVVRNVGIEAAVLNIQEQYPEGQTNDERWYYWGDGNYWIENVGILADNAGNQSKISQCYTKGVIYMPTGTDYAAGLIGHFNGDSIVNSYARVDIYQKDNLDYVGASVARNGSSENNMENCYSAGHTRKGVTWGTHCYYDKDLTTEAYYDGAKTTNEMHAMSTFVNWDFNSIWGRSDTINDGYPYLRAFYANPPENDPDPVMVSGIVLAEAGTTIPIVAGQQVQLHASILPAEAACKTIIYSSGNNELATVDENGLVTALYRKSYSEYATVTITAATQEGGYSQTCTLSILYPSMSIYNPIAGKHKDETEWGYPGNNSKWYLGVNRQYIIYAKTNPDTVISPVTWTSSNEALAVVRPLSKDTLYNNAHVAMAIVEAKAEGSVTITATNSAGLSANKSWTVQYYPLISLTINGNTSMNVGETQQLTYSYEGYKSEIPTNVVWQSDNASVVSVSPDGLVTAVGLGTATITATAGTCSATFTITVDGTTYYLVNFLNWNGNVLQSSQVQEGSIPTYNGATPTRPDDANHTYTFSGWTPTIVAATADADYTAQFTATAKPKYYTIRFLNWDGTELQSTQVKKGERPAYNGETPTKPEDEDYTYSFSGWSPTIVAATADADYTAQFTATAKPKYYTIRFLNYDGSELQPSQVLEGNMPTYSGAMPVRPEDENYTYSFSGWSPTIVAATADADYTAQFTATAKPKYYTIRFLNYDGTELQSSQVLEGDMPTYSSAMPVRPEDENYTYSFSGWSPAVVAATADADYTAQYTATEKTVTPPQPVYYTVTFMDWDGTELLVETVEEGHDAQGPETNPTREGYIFTGWSKPITNITANLIVIAQYEIIPQPVYYTIRFLNWDGEELQSSQVKEGEIPTYSGATPVRPEDEQYIYTFNGWTPTIVAVTADATYTATYEAKDKSEGIEDIFFDASSAPRKVLINNVIYILRGEKTYTLTGQETIVP